MRDKLLKTLAEHAAELVGVVVEGHWRAGSGDVQASGRVAKLDVSIAGSGDVRTRELAAGDVSVSIAGSGDGVAVPRSTATRGRRRRRPRRCPR